MKTILTFSLILLAVGIGHAAITIPGITGTPAAGSDDAFVNSSQTVVDLSEANDGAWDSIPTRPGKGVYDAGKWAVVFKYSSVDLGYGVTFKNHPSHAPVVWLVSGDVNIRSPVSLDGEPGGGQLYAEPGPGGFRGANRMDTDGSGFGPGGAKSGPVGAGLGASRVTKPGAGSGQMYGREDLIPLLGGSGGGNRTSDNLGYSGGGGGGAILIVASGKIMVEGPSGKITANGGITYAGGGSGGGIRLVASEISGTGILEAFCNNSGDGSLADKGSDGYIRTEALSFNGPDARPAAKATFLVEPVVLWPTDDLPSARIVSVGGMALVRDPHADMTSGPTDISLPPGGSRTVVVETRNLPVTAEVTVFVIPAGSPRSEVPATHVSIDGTSSRWEATLPGGAVGRVALQVRAVAP